MKISMNPVRGEMLVEKEIIVSFIFLRAVLTAGKKVFKIEFI
jgi:hypothetical protein